MKKIFIIEDHDQALKVWQKNNIKGLDLVHLDAHLDFSFHPAKPIPKIFEQASTIKELKKDLEYTLAFLHYEKDLSKQTNIGNYIYPAIEQGIVKNVWWVIPGWLKKVENSFKLAEITLKDILRQENKAFRSVKFRKNKGLISCSILGRDFFVSTLDSLPRIEEPVLLDIDTDFLVIEDIRYAENTQKIGKRKPWILPQQVYQILKEKVTQPRLITIAYSVNGGWTPLIYRYLADELAYCFSPSEFKKRFLKSSRACQYFSLFNSTHRKEYYLKAVRLDSTFRCPDNNYGPLYLLQGRLTKAEREFSRILKVDRNNPSCLVGLAEIYLARKDLNRAKRYFLKALNTPFRDSRLSQIKERLFVGLAKVELKRNNLIKAKQLLNCAKKISSLNPQISYWLGFISQKEKDFSSAVLHYQDAIRLGFEGISALWQMAKISKHLKEKTAIIKYISSKYKDFKRNFSKLERQTKKKVKGLKRTKKILLALEKKLREVSDARFTCFSQKP